ncbi:hypothetical protein EYF80_016035 [Liparis tanakae]|uniref:Uncharacterized protein n=1 Tax=Liparis tanakae TaxID=230148 RepID=A0A4Z2I8C9_9TELE|nr:hypothetical protein EYF80_016035 [Liparis tanakae]
MEVEAIQQNNGLLCPTLLPLSHRRKAGVGERERERKVAAVAKSELVLFFFSRLLHASLLQFLLPHSAPITPPPAAACSNVFTLTCAVSPPLDKETERSPGDALYLPESSRRDAIEKRRREEEKQRKRGRGQRAYLCGWKKGSSRRVEVTQRDEYLI